ncbi:GNAT family N-acetyltransferase [Rarobacter faecitabidus]|nr:GNAT family N-acetyltransferase [Rarobacter faecitabidus]
MNHAPDITRIQTAQDIRSAYDGVLTPSFPERELSEFAPVASSIESGELVAFGTHGPGGEVASMIGVEVRGRVAMIVYLAIAPSLRGGGIGGALLDRAVRYARDEAGADYVLLEVERPDVHASSPEFGDPVRRLRFYERRGLEVLDVPFFVPSLRPGFERTPALLLGTLWASDAVRAGEGVLAAPILDFIREYFTATEGSFGEDEASAAIADALAGRTVRLRPAADYANSPAGLLPGSLIERPDPPR